MTTNTQLHQANLVIEVDGKSENFEPIMSSQQITKRVNELAQSLADHYLAQGGEVLAMTVMSGANNFAVELRTAMQAYAPQLKLTSDYVQVKSYENNASTGEITYVNQPQKPIAGKHILIIEDIIDSGLTAKWLAATFAAEKPASIALVTLLHKPDVTPLAKLTSDLTASAGRDITLHVGFSIDNRFVIGHGLDYDQLYRDLPDIYAMV